MLKKTYPMDNENKVTPEELAAEQAATQEIKEDEVRSHVIEEYGFDETADAEKITKAVAKEIKNRKLVSTAIGQKIKYRNLLPKKDGDGKKVEPQVQNPAPEKKEDISTEDIYALVQAQIPKEDVEEVKKAAKLLGKTISEALQDNMVKTILAKRSEERATAEAANTNGTRRTNAKVTDSTIVKDLSEGKIPEKGTDEAEQLFWAKRGGKR